MKWSILAFVFALTLVTNLPAQTFTTLHSFTGGDGASPWASLIISSNTLYGTTTAGGNSGSGTVFKVNIDGSNFQNLHSFSAIFNFTNSDGASPRASLILSGSTLYGTTYSGGNSGNGTVFKVNTDGSNFQNLHTFSAPFNYVGNGTNIDGTNPKGNLILSGSTLYGTATYGGSSGYGTLFKINTDGTGFTILNVFTNGVNPESGMILLSNMLYGTTAFGGASGLIAGMSYGGTIFQINTDGTDFNILYSFTSSDGADGPAANLFLSGNTLYGTTTATNISNYSPSFVNASGSGAIFKVNTDGSNFSVLRGFGDQDSDGGITVNDNLTLSGNVLYGTLNGSFLYNQNNQYGMIFAINVDGSGFTNLYNFTPNTNNNVNANYDGAHPYAGLILNNNTLYGTTTAGGSSDNGTVFALSLPPPSVPTITIQPQSQTIQVGSNVIFTVVANGSPSPNYQWYFNSTPLIGQTGASLSLNNVQLSNGGNYSVAIANAYGSTNSVIAQLTVFAPLTLTPTNRVPTNEITNPFVPTNHLEVFSGGKFKTGIALNKNRMTIVMTHGFMSSPNSWATNMATFILAHVSVPTPNIVAWDWSAEAGTNLTDLPVVSATQPLVQGFALATNLLAALGTSYSQRIHFIGHSLGTLVNSVAANYLHGDAPNNSHQYFNPTNTQMTLFDEAEAAPELDDALVALSNHQQDVRVFYDTPIPARAAWIDNYISAFGLPHPEAANVILTKGAVFAAPDINSFINDINSFHGYPYVWYDDSVTNSASGSALMGYRWSFEKNNLTGMPATNTMFIQTSANPELTLQQTNFDYGVNVLIARLPLYVINAGVSAFAVAFDNIARIVGQVTGEIESTKGMIINLVTGGRGSVSQNSLVRSSGVQADASSSGTNTPAYAWIPLVVPANTVSLSFDFMLQGNGSNDNFEVALNGTNVLSLATSMIQTNVTLNSGLIDVSKYAGTNVELFLGIVGGTSTNASLTASDFEFYAAAQPALQAQVLSNKLIASWPLSASGYTLETSTNLTGAWTAVTNVPAIANLQNVVTNSFSGGARFYRLKQ